MSANMIWNVVYVAKQRFFAERTMPRDVESDSGSISFFSADHLGFENVEADTYTRDLTHDDLTWIDWDSALPTDEANMF